MKKRYGKGLWIPAPDGGLQGLVLVDSYPAMNPEANDEEEANNSLGLHARFFAKHLPRVKGRLARKMVALVGVNQLREIPMAMYGPKEKEACGQALRFNSDCRNWWNSRSSGMPFNPKFDTEEKVEIESSVEGEGKDRYRYVQVVNKKNKLASPGRKMWVRIWVSNYTGEACGFDPFFDVAQYLRDTGQLKSKNRKVMTLELDGLGKAKKTIDWMTLKRWVLGTKEQKIQICKSLGYNPMDLRKFCFSQMEKGKGEELYVKARNSGKSEDDGE
jgi:RecA/RadA recombinase